MTFLDHLNWRYNTKNFDPTYQIPDQSLNKILQAIQFAPTSFGLQPYHVYIVTNPSIKKQLREQGFNQSQFETASAVLVFAARTDLTERISQYQEISQAPEQYIDSIKGFIQNMDLQTQKSWTHRQTYIALGFALAAAAELQIDTCPMEGFDPTGFNQILNIKAPLNSIVALPIGKRQKDPDRPKVRFSKEDLFTTV